MKTLTTLDQLSTLKNTTITNPISVLKHSYHLDRIFEIENKGQIAVQLIQAMKKDIALKGIKESPRDEVLDDVIRMLLKTFQHLTPIEIELALEMERFGEFETRTEHYQFYGAEYVAEVLRKYISWKHTKAMELNLSRKVNQIEVKPDLEQINKDYLDTILNELKQGKILRHINSNQLYKEIPESEKLNENQRFRLFQHEQKKLKAENEIRKSKEVDAVRLKKLSEVIEQTFESTLENRCKNVATCIWLAKKHNIELNDNQF